MKTQLNMRVSEVQHLSGSYALLALQPIGGATLPPNIAPGQFAQVRVPDSPATYLRRPISICLVSYSRQMLWLLVRDAGAGTHRLVNCAPGDVYSIILPLGHGFSFPKVDCVLLVGGGVGVAPLLYYGQQLSRRGIVPHFALGARSKADLLLLDEFAKYGPVSISTDDGSAGEPGVITLNSAFKTDYQAIACCGPTPMMRAVARLAKQKGIPCEVSLENMMACGIGACLCCVEDTTDGNICVCTEGPVFNINRLKWEL